MFMKLLAIFLFAISIANPLKAQDIEQYISFAETANWVEPHEAGAGEFELGQDQDRIYRLIDRQRQVTPDQDHFYYRGVTTLLSSEAVDEYGSIHISFNPSFENVTLHHVRILRPSGELLDVTKQAELQLYRVETEREQLIYNGLLELAILVPQLKQGDTLDYAFTSSGRNPALTRHWQHAVRHSYARPTQRLHDRLLVAEGTPAFFQAHNGAPEPTVRHFDGFTEYSWDARNVPLQRYEDNTPIGYLSGKRTTVSSIESWREIGEFFAPLYDPAQFQNARIAEIAEDIRTRHPADPQAQLRAALAYVQKEVRYTAVQLGVGGFVPRDPQRVLERGFGDCKDMTVLLTSILYALNVEATPLLVSIDMKAGVTDDRPRIATFDHVVVRAHVGGRNFVLDPTRGEQLGDLEHVQQGDFEKGVVIAPDSVGMIDARVPRPDFYEDIVDTFDFTADPNAILLTSKATYFGKAADRMLAWVQRDGEASIDESYLDYFKGLHSSIEILRPLTLEVDEDKAVLSVTSYYKLTDPWLRDEELGGRVFWASPDDLYSKLPTLDDEKRVSPMASHHPMRFRHQIKLITDKSWAHENSTFSQSTAAFDVKMVARSFPGTATKTYSFVTKSDRILPQDWSQTRKALQLFEERKWTRIQLPDENAFIAFWGLNEMSDEDWEIAGALLILALILIPLLVVLFRPQQPQLPELKLQILYPVSTFKFLVMSIGTLGFYTYYWYWQNWRWMREVDHLSVSPFWRGFVFPAIWNFSLFSRIASHPPHGSRAIVIWAMPLATLNLVIQALNQVYDAWDLLPFVSAIAATLVALPFQREVLRKNVENQKWVKRNSRFGWQAIALLAMWLPTMLLMLIGATGEF